MTGKRVYLHSPAARQPTRTAMAQVEYLLWKLFLHECRTLNTKTPSRQAAPITPSVVDPSQRQAIVAAVHLHEQERDVFTSDWAEASIYAKLGDVILRVQLVRGLGDAATDRLSGSNKAMELGCRPRYRG